MEVSSVRRKLMQNSNIMKMSSFLLLNKLYSNHFITRNGYPIYLCVSYAQRYWILKKMFYTYSPDQWRLFIDSSKISLKAVLLHNGNELPSVPLAHGVHVKETYENLKNLLQQIQYAEHSCKICADLKVVRMLLGMQASYTKFYCFICKWDSRSRGKHYTQKEWPKRTHYIA